MQGFTEKDWKLFKSLFSIFTARRKSSIMGGEVEKKDEKGIPERYHKGTI